MSNFFIWVPHFSSFFLLYFPFGWMILRYDEQPWLHSVHQANEDLEQASSRSLLNVGGEDGRKEEWKLIGVFWTTLPSLFMAVGHEVLHNQTWIQYNRSRFSLLEGSSNIQEKTCVFILLLSDSFFKNPIKRILLIKWLLGITVMRPSLREKLQMKAIQSYG